MRAWCLTKRKQHMRSLVDEERITRPGSNAETPQGPPSIQTRASSTKHVWAYLNECPLRPSTINLPEHDLARRYEKGRLG